MQVIDKARWMHTGDLAVLDADGYCRIVGRLKDVIIRGGENISPREIEEVIHQHASVMDVQVSSCCSCSWCTSPALLVVTSNDATTFFDAESQHFACSVFLQEAQLPVSQTASWQGRYGSSQSSYMHL